MTVHRLRLRPVPEQVRVARDFTARQLTDAVDADSYPGELVDDAALITSELVTNAMQAGACFIQLELGVEAPSFRIAVIDDAGGEIVPRAPSPADTSGRGLPIVNALSERWGVERLPERTRVWAELLLTRIDRHRLSDAVTG